MCYKCNCNPLKRDYYVDAGGKVRETMDSSIMNSFREANEKDRLQREKAIEQENRRRYPWRYGKW
jgi:hypothetical protein